MARVRYIEFFFRIFFSEFFLHIKTCILNHLIQYIKMVCFCFLCTSRLLKLGNLAEYFSPFYRFWCHYPLITYLNSTIQYSITYTQDKFARWHQHNELLFIRGLTYFAKDSIFQFSFWCHYYFALEKKLETTKRYIVKEAVHKYYGTRN